MKDREGERTKLRYIVRKKRGEMEEKERLRERKTDRQTGRQTER